jgi:hypothetical protein
LAIVVAGMFLAGDRRTASAWFVAAGGYFEGVSRYSNTCRFAAIGFRFLLERIHVGTE